MALKVPKKAVALVLPKAAGNVPGPIFTGGMITSTESGSSAQLRKWFLRWNY
jgi:hypothetical protein